MSKLAPRGSGSQITPQSSPRPESSRTEASGKFRDEKTAKSKLSTDKARELAEKRKAKAKAIERYEYDLSAKIQAEINDLLAAEHDQLIEDEKQNLQAKLRKIFDTYDSQLDKVQETIVDKEKDARKEIEVKREDMENRHIAELTEIEVHRSLAETKEKEREPGEYVRTLSQSRRLAATDKVPEAKRLLEEAKTQLGEQRQQAVHETNLKYDKRVKSILKRHRQDAMALQAELDGALDIIEQQKAELELCALKTAKVCIQASLTAAIARVLKQAENPAIRPKVQDKLKEEMTRFLVEQQREDLQ
jgi:hypothetical protein